MVNMNRIIENYCSVIIEFEDGNFQRKMNYVDKTIWYGYKNWKYDLWKDDWKDFENRWWVLYNGVWVKTETPKYEIEYQRLLREKKLERILKN